MKNLKVVVLTVLIAFAMTAVASAQVKKIGYLDLSKTFDNYLKTKDFDSVLEEKSKGYEATRKPKIDKFTELSGKVSLLKEEEKDKAIKELEGMRTEINKFDQAQRTDLGKERDEKIREILLEIEEVVSDFAQKEKYDFVLNDRVLIYGNEVFDISDQILKILNDSYNKK